MDVEDPVGVVVVDVELEVVSCAEVVVDEELEVVGCIDVDEDDDVEVVGLTDVVVVVVMSEVVVVVPAITSKIKTGRSSCPKTSSAGLLILRPAQL